MKIYTLNQVQDELIGKKGTPERELFESELQIDSNPIKFYFFVYFCR